MGISLEEYAARFPQEAPEGERKAMAAQAATIRDRREERERAAQLKESILQQLESGQAPHCILYTAVSAIGLLSQDDEFTSRAQEILNSVYEDLEQQSMINDNAAIAAARLDTMTHEYNGKLRRQLERQLQGYSKIQHGLNEALNALNSLEPENSIEP